MRGWTTMAYPAPKASTLGSHLFGKACAALQGTPPLERTRETTATLRATHPRAASHPNLSDIGLASRACVPDLDADLVEGEKKSADRRSKSKNEL